MPSLIFTVAAVYHPALHVKIERLLALRIVHGLSGATQADAYLTFVGFRVAHELEARRIRCEALGMPAADSLETKKPGLHEGSRA
jgi:hypothetical protein